MFSSQGGRPLSVCTSLLLLPVAFACQPFNPWLCKVTPRSTMLLCILSGVISFCSPGIHGRFSSPGITHFLCQEEPWWHSGAGSGPLHCTCPLPSRDKQLRSKGCGQEAPEISHFSSILRDLLAESPLINGFCPPNNQPGKLYACEKEQVNLLDLVKDRI